ncbi:MAG TPA: hypothetical protein VFO14_17880 [Vicinamibacterales bacterium]|nr:hypothetical protein [Vicinamibacterales bacterium]
MPDAPDPHLLEARPGLLDRNNAIMINLLRAIPEGALEVKALGRSPSLAQQFMQRADPHEMPPWPERARE